MQNVFINVAVLYAEFHFLILFHQIAAEGAHGTDSSDPNRGAAAEITFTTSRIHFLKLTSQTFWLSWWLHFLTLGQLTDPSLSLMSITFCIQPYVWYSIMMFYILSEPMVNSSMDLAEPPMDTSVKLRYTPTGGHFDYYLFELAENGRGKAMLTYLNYKVSFTKMQVHLILFN